MVIRISGCWHRPLQAPCPSEWDIKCPLKANLAVYVCIKSLAISPKSLLYHLDSCKVFLSGTQGIFVDITSRQAETKPGLTLRLDTGTGIAARFSRVSGGCWGLSFTQAALGVFNASTQHHAETSERALGRDWARWASGSAGSLLRAALSRHAACDSLWHWAAVTGHLCAYLSTSPTHRATKASLCQVPWTHLCFDVSAGPHKSQLLPLTLSPWPSTALSFTVTSHTLQLLTHPLSTEAKSWHAQCRATRDSWQSGQTQVPPQCSLHSPRGWHPKLPGLACTEHHTHADTYI